MTVPTSFSGKRWLKTMLPCDFHYSRQPGKTRRKYVHFVRAPKWHKHERWMSEGAWQYGTKWLAQTIVANRKAWCWIGIIFWVTLAVSGSYQYYIDDFCGQIYLENSYELFKSLFWSLSTHNWMSAVCRDTFTDFKQTSDFAFKCVSWTILAKEGFLAI